MTAPATITDAEIDAAFAECGWDRFNHIALAVSGGADSTALVFMAHAWTQRRPPPLPRITLLTVDHRLRAASAAEAQWVAALATHLGLPHETLVWTAAKPKSGIQEAARAARYALLARACHGNGIEALATAHNADDQAETLIMRLARGSGADGLAAMAPVSSLDGLSLLRPLLGLTRARLEAYLGSLGQRWVDDPSNEEDKYERVSIRRALRGSAAMGLTVPALVLSAKRLGRARDALEAATADVLRAGLVVHEAGYGEISMAALTAPPEEIGLRALARMSRTFGGREQPPRLAGIEALYGALCGGASDATLGGCVFAVRRGRLRVMREAGRMSTAPQTIYPGETVLWDGRFTVTLPADSPGPAALRPLGASGLDALRVMGASPGGMPRAAALALPSLWQEERLSFVPFTTWKDRVPHEQHAWPLQAAIRFTGHSGEAGSPATSRN